MAYVSQVEYETATDEAKAEFEDQIQRHGRITNMKKRYCILFHLSKH
ncbi:hypothetical protein [Kurthia senegalensis]|nr:hypothetical protein [Kurthia senegalensis]